MYFEVWTKSGEIMEYGRTQDSQVNTADGKIQRWALNRVIDTAQNYFDVSYFENTALGEHRVSRIDYTGNLRTGAGFHSHIDFVYESRPDPSYGFLAQSRISSTTRLKAIRVREGSAQVRSYQFDYFATGYAAPRSRLAQVRMCMGEDNANDCVPPTLIEWHTPAHPKTDNLFGGPILSPVASIGDSASRDAARVLDFNGDGIADLAYPTRKTNGALVVDIYGRNGGVVKHLTYTEGIPPVENGPWKGAPFIVMDVDGDGDSDILVPQASWQVYYDDGENLWLNWHLDGWKKLSYSGGAIVDSDQEIADTASEDGNSWGCGGIGKIPSNCMPIVMDANGDGLQDLVFPKHASTGSLFSPIQWELKLNKRNAPGQFYSAGSAGLPMFDDKDRLMVIDVNGDGMQDLFSVNNWIYFSNGNSFSGVKVGWNEPKNENVSMVIDINGDGYQDIVWFNKGTVYYRLNWGGTRTFPGRAGFSTNVRAAEIYKKSDGSILKLVTAPGKSRDDAQSANPIDWDKDGVTDILLAHKEGAQRTWWVLLTRFNTAGVPYFEAINTGILTGSAYKHHPQVADFDGDGFEDLIYGNNYRWELRRRIKIRSDLVRRITAGRGRFDDVIEIDYRPLTDSGMHKLYSNFRAAQQGYRYIQAPMYVVSGTRRDNGIGGYHVQNFRYEGARVSLRGRGFQGFAKQVTTDVTAGLIEIQLFKQDFPFTGSLAEKEVKRSADGRRLSLMRRPVFNKGGGSIRAKFYSPWVPKTYDYSYDLQSGSLVSYKTTELGARDVAGNFGLHTITTHDVLRGGKTHIKTTQSEYDNNATYWLFGRLKQSTVTHSGTAYPVGQSIKRKSSFSYFMDPVGEDEERPTGFLKCEVIEPDNGQYKQTTCHEYDDYGNERQTVVSGYLVDPRQTDTPYDAQGRFPLKTINALGHEEQYTYNSRFGFRTSLKGPNDLITTWIPDALGRMKQEIRADGTSTTVIRQWDTPGCPAIAVYRVDTITSGQPRQYQCMDKKNRVVREAVEGFSPDQWKKKDTEYDALGRVTRVSRPFFNQATYWTTTSYDILNRPTEVSSPVNGTTTYEYSVSHTPSHRGQRVTTTTEVTYQTDHGPVRAPDQVNIVISNALGQKLAVRDALGNWMNFTYDATGNRTGITDAHGNHTTIAYTLRGDKLSQDDPDMGYWSYAYNGLGELIRQTDAKGQTLVMSYDALGRLRERYVEGNRANTLETWEWDNLERGKSLGKLTGESSRHYQRAYFYDDLGRRNRTDTYIDKTLDGDILDNHGASYSESLTFDSYGRIARRLYAGGQMSLDYHYNGQGYLAYVEDAATGAVYWYGRQTNADGAFTEEVIGDLDV
ncbi:MAG TPA: hypothetical protein ENJ12_13355, partial [Thiolapillus brandeum]|nr:hypothetical protein [Thiolapillus brandeum]